MSDDVRPVLGVLVGAGVVPLQVDPAGGQHVLAGELVNAERVAPRHGSVIRHRASDSLATLAQDVPRHCLHFTATVIAWVDLEPAAHRHVGVRAGVLGAGARILRPAEACMAGRSRV